MPDDNTSENNPKPNDTPTTKPSTPQNPENTTTPNNQTNNSAPGATDGAAAGTETTQNGENAQQPAQQAASSGKALKEANKKAMEAEIPFAIGLESLPADVLRNDTTNGTAAGAAGAGGGGVFPAGGPSSAIDVPWSQINMDGHFNADMNAKQLVCPMTLFQSFPVITSSGVVTRATDFTSTTDGAGTNVGGLADASVNGGKSGFPDGCNPAVLKSQHNGRSY